MPVTCFVSYELHPTTIGGCGVLIHHAAELLLKAGHEVVFLLDFPVGVFEKLARQDLAGFGHAGRVRAYRVDDLCGDAAWDPEQFSTVFQAKSYRFACALRKLSETERLDAVEYFDYCGAGYYSFADRLFDASATESGPVLTIRLHGSLEVLDRHGQGVVKDLDRLMIHAFERRALALSEAVLAPSRTYYEEYYRELYSLEPGRVVVSSPPKQAFPQVQRHPGPAEPFTIAFIGRMFHLKGADQLVHAGVMLMKQRPELNFTVEMIGYDSDEGPGHGSYTAYLRTLIPGRLRERFLFTGQLSHEQIAARLEHALFAVFPNRIESFCYALHEVYDAGVPVVVNDIPAFADFFHHERNALLYDGTTQGLVASMRRMIDDAPLRDRVRRPYPVADHPIGEFYDHPTALVPLAGRGGGVAMPLVVVMCSREELESATVLASLRAQQGGIARIVCLIPAQPDAEETLWWLGRAWHVRSPEGQAVETSDVLTTGSLCVLHADDEPAPGWLSSCTGALSRRADMAFAGTWSLSNGNLLASTIDVMPELYPYEQGADLARVVVRTDPGVPLADLFDPSLGALGHTGYLWYAVQRWGHGVLKPEVMISTHTPATAADAGSLRALLTRYGEGFAERLALLAGMVTPSRQGFTEPKSVRTVTRTLEDKVRVADQLGGSLLARMALKKLARRVRSGGLASPPDGV